MTINAGNVKIAKLESLLEASNTKYSEFKSKVKEYKKHKEAKEEQYKKCIKKLKEDFIAKGLEMRNHLQDIFTSEKETHLSDSKYE